MVFKSIIGDICTRQADVSLPWGKLLAGLLLSVTTDSMAVTLHTADGFLTGASDINVGDILYDVEFIDGTIYSVYGNPPARVATTFDKALEFSKALANQVFTGSIYDEKPELTSGCGSLSHCDILTPYILWETNWQGLSFYNTSALGFTGSHGIASGYDLDLTAYDDMVWASWSVATVPVPAAVWLFGSGLIGLIGVARRKA